MRLQIPPQTPLAFITLVGACGGAQSTDEAITAGMVSLQCDGDALSPEIIAELGEHGFVDGTFQVATERSEEWLVETRAVLDRLAARLAPIEGSEFQADHVRAGEILVLTDSELTDATELLLITRWSVAEFAPTERPDPSTLVGYTTAVLQCSPAGLWEPVAHNDLNVPDAFVGITGVSIGETQQGLIHTVILKEINAYAYSGEQFDFALVLGNENARAESEFVADGEYGYLDEPDDDVDNDWGPLSYLGQLYSVGYGLGAYSATYDSMTGTMDASNWFPVVEDEDGPEAEFTDLFLAMRVDEYYSYAETEYDDADSPESPSAIEVPIGTRVAGNEDDSDMASSTAAQIFNGAGGEQLAGLESTNSPPASSVFIHLFAAGGISADRFQALYSGMAGSFVLLVAPNVTARCHQNGIVCRTLSENDRELFSHTEFAATRVGGVWTTWQAAAQAASDLGLDDTDYLILGPDPRLSPGHRLAYFGNDSEDFLSDPDAWVRELHPRLRYHIEYRR